MNLPEVQMLWVRGPLSTLERLSIASFLRHGHPVRLFAYGDIPNLPAGAVLEDAAQIIPEKEVFTNPGAIGHGGLSMFSNFFRYRLLLSRGGVWADCDLVCVKPLLFANTMEHFFASERILNPFDPSVKPFTSIQSCILKAPPGSPIVARAQAIAGQVDLANSLWGSSGPRAVHAAVVDNNATNCVMAPDTFCPFGWWQVPEFVSPTVQLIPEGAHAIHLFNEIWRRNFIDKNARYDPLSLYERLKRHYLDE